MSTEQNLEHFLGKKVELTGFFYKGQTARVEAITTTGVLVVKMDQDGSLKMTSPEFVKKIYPRVFAAVGYDPENNVIFVGDTKDNAQYARNSFKKHFPNAECLDVIATNG